MATEKIVYDISVTGNASSEFDKTNKVYSDLKKNIEKPIKEIPLTRQLREIKMEMQKLDQSGQGVGTKTFDELAKRAGNIKDSMNAANEAINVRAVGSNLEQNLNLMKSGFDTVVGSAQVATGTMALFGVENENVAESIQKMMALQSLSTGVMTVWKNISKEGILVQTIMNTKIVAATAIQGVYTAAVGSSTGALKAMRVAALGLSGIGIAALIAGVTIGISKFNEWTEATWDAEKQLNNFKNNLITTLNELNNIKNEITDFGGTEKEAISYTNKELEKQLSLLEKKTKQELGIDVLTAKRITERQKELELAKIWNEKQAIYDKYKKFGLAQFYSSDDIKGAKAVADSYNDIKDAMTSNVNQSIKLGVQDKKNKKSSTLQNEETYKLINQAPDTFNVYIESLGTIIDPVIVGIQDEKDLQSKIVNIFASALRTIQVQNA